MRSLVDGGPAKRWTARVVTAGGVWGLLVLALGAADAGPRAVPLAAVVVGITITVSLALDLGNEPIPPRWPTTPLAEAPRNDDPRVRRLQQLVDSARSDDGRSGPLRRILHAVVDERVAARHGVTHDAEPQRYDEIVGPELIAWLRADEPDHPAPPTTRRELLGILHRIEDL